MKYRPLGDTGIEVSLLGLGTVKLGRDQGVKYPTAFKIPDDQQALALIGLAEDLGVNLIDTAPAYGSSETRLGELLQGRRQRWVICSKVGEEFVDGQSYFNFTPEHTRMSVERSLQRLRTDYIDIVLIHSDGDDMAILQKEGTLQALAELKAKGMIRAIGLSGKTVEGGIAALQQGDVAMVTYNLEHQEEKPVLDYAQAHQKGVLIKKALASGHICVGPHEDPLRKSMEFVFAHPGVSSAIIGTINPEHFKENVRALPV
ncbi:aldo/keto reductase [Hahella sp. HN01]|uniref:aldo/keto reductase n=1 Tax=Hahella sp. HN01 TaxID=2847262 RepID=UPI001C1EE248|nr:aldo/keto reductase [Hahella sp. HN01]MBU6953913.1 aldo/keto reductase [Hahella sp. HN01]